MTGSGDFYHIRPVDGGGYSAEALGWGSPLNVAAYEASDAGRSSAFRALDLIERSVDGDIRVLATHHYWHADRGCFVVRLSELAVDAELRSGGDWQPLYETSPCLTPSGEESRRPPGIQLQSGGRMAWLEPGRLLVTVGDHGFDGWNQAYVAAQSESWDYGRTLAIDLESGTAESFAIGQRNPQGLHVDPSGRIWSTEHGPQGGDELNLVVRGANYGWPYQTGGTDYGRRVWPVLDESRGPFADPALAWVPSIGISEVLMAPPSFGRWQGDLLVASLRAQTLFHLALSGDRVLYSEPIRIGRRIRDATYGPDGSVWLWTDTGDLVVISVMAEADRGEELFTACGTCHLTADADGSGGIAPSLRGIVGRPVAAMDFDYSPALAEMDGTWTAERLDRFMADPAAFAPGTSMAFPGIPDPEDRAALMTYLRELR